MANVARIEFAAEVPFNWMSELDANEVSMFSGWMLNPVSGLDWEFEDRGYRDNENGGRTSMWLLHIWGEEAIWGSTIKAWVEAIERIGGTVERARHTDLEWDPRNIETTVYV